MPDDVSPRFWGLLQFTSALTIPPTLGKPRTTRKRASMDQLRGIEEPFDVLTQKHIQEAVADLEQILPRDSDRYTLTPAYQTANAFPEGPNHTWLGPLSRHAPIALPPAFHFPNSPDFPILLRWPCRNSQHAIGNPYLRTQRARDPKTKDLIENVPPDCNDYLVEDGLADSQPDYADLLQLRAFLACLYAQQRMRIFASDLSHRIYNVWLPPGILNGVHDLGESRRNGAFAVLPFLTRIRQPYRLSFGRTVILSVVLAPVRLQRGNVAVEPRQISSAEVTRLGQSLEGDSSHVPKEADDRYKLLASPLWNYVTHLELQHTWSVTRTLAVKAARTHMEATIRQWTELALSSVAEPVFPAVGQKARPSKSFLADEVLKAIRLNTVWSILVLDSALLPYDPTRDSLCDGPWWPSGPPGWVPASLSELLRDLAGTNRLPASVTDRIDDGRSGIPAALMWGFAQHQSVVTAYSEGFEQFPGHSALTLFGWTNQLLTGASSSKALMVAMATESEHSRDRDVSKLARTSYDLTLEMEEMFDLKIAWPEYKILYNCLKIRLGIVDAFERMRERREELTHHAEIVVRTREERSIHVLQWLAVILAFGIMAVGVEAVFQAHDMKYAFGWLSIVTAGIVVSLACLLAIAAWLLRLRR